MIWQMDHTPIPEEPVIKSGDRVRLLAETTSCKPGDLGTVTSVSIEEDPFAIKCRVEMDNGVTLRDVNQKVLDRVGPVEYNPPEGGTP